MVDARGDILAASDPCGDEDATASIWLDGYAQKLHAFSPMGQEKWSVGALCRPRDLRMAANGSVYAADADGRIQVFSADGVPGAGIVASGPEDQRGNGPRLGQPEVADDGTVYACADGYEVLATRPGQEEPDWRVLTPRVIDFKHNGALVSHDSRVTLAPNGTLWVLDSSQVAAIPQARLTPQARLARATAPTAETPSGSVEREAEAVVIDGVRVARKGAR
jgi:outer membrane protein assembly factor BamB